jgi:hypothetical protein
VVDRKLAILSSNNIQVCYPAPTFFLIHLDGSI